MEVIEIVKTQSNTIEGYSIMGKGSFFDHRQKETV